MAHSRVTMRSTILEALERLLQHQTYTEIHISDICEEAHISKPTFYRYFENKDDIVRWIARYALEVGVAEIGRTFSWREGYFRTSSVHYQHKTLFCDKQSPTLISKLIGVSSTYLRECLTDTLVHYANIELSGKLEFQIECLVTSQGIMSRRWAETNMQLPPDVIADYFESVVPHDLFKLLNEPRMTTDESL